MNLHFNQEMAEGCLAFMASARVQRHFKVAATALSPRERAALRADGSIKPKPVSVKPVKLQKPRNKIGRARRAALACINQFPVDCRGKIAAFAHREGVSVQAASQALKQIRYERALAENVAHRKIA